LNKPGCTKTVNRSFELDRGFQEHLRFAVHPAIAYTRCMRVTNLLPRLVVADADRAMAFYRDAFGATEVACHRTADGKVVHAELSMDGFSFAVKDADAFDPGPAEIGGTPVIFRLDTDDSDSVFHAAIKHGAEVIFPLETRSYGPLDARDARIKDPSGHVWIISTPVAAGR
jgi:PhnB protein